MRIISIIWNHKLCHWNETQFVFQGMENANACDFWKLLSGHFNATVQCLLCGYYKYDMVVPPLVSALLIICILCKSQIVTMYLWLFSTRILSKGNLHTFSDLKIIITNRKLIRDHQISIISQDQVNCHLMVFFVQLITYKINM